MNLKPYALAAGLIVTSAIGIKAHIDNPNRTYDTIGLNSYIQEIVEPLLHSPEPKKDRAYYVNLMGIMTDSKLLNTTHTKLINPQDDDKPYSYTQSGYGFVFGCKYLSMAHVVNKEKIKIVQFTPFGPRPVDVPLDRDRVIEELTFIDDFVLGSIVEDSNRDIAVFNLPDELKHYCNDMTLDDLATSDEVYVSMKVHWNGNPGLVNDVYRESTISQLFDEKDEGSGFVHSFMLNNHVVPGSSGNTVWAKVKGKWKIIGLIQGDYNGLGIVKSIDDFIPYLDLKIDEVN